MTNSGRAWAIDLDCFYPSKAADVERIVHPRGLDSCSSLFSFCSHKENIMAEKHLYSGQCHCGAVRYSVNTDLTGLGDCNCSRCRRLGWVMQSVPEADFTLEAGGENLTTYRFNTEAIDHLFCKTCGIESFARGSDGKGNVLYMINVNCLEGAPPVDRSAIKHWDGANF
jgi:hypothetical protein